MIRTRSVHAASGSPTPKVSAAYDNTHFNAQINALFDAAANFKHYRVFQTYLCISGKRLATELQQHPFVFWGHTIIPIFFPFILHDGLTCVKPIIDAKPCICG
jgi:hypothetical protein